MRHLLLLILPAIFGLAFAGTQSSGEQNLDYNPLVGPDPNPKRPLVQQTHGSKGNPLAAANIPQGGNSQGRPVDYDPLVGPGNSPNGPTVVQQHGYNGVPQVNPVAGTGGSSNDDDGGVGVMRVHPQIIPNGAGDDSGNADVGVGPVLGGLGGQKGVTGQNVGGTGGARGAGGSSDSRSPNMAGGSPIAGANAAEAGGSSNNGFIGAPNAAQAVGGADVGHRLSQNQDLKAADGMPAGAVAGVVVGVVAVAALGTAVAVVVLRSGASFISAA